MLKIFKELKRRKVLTTLGVYAGAAVIIIQVADVVFPALRFPDWTVAFVVVLIFLGFPITFFLSWTYDLKREAEVGDKLDHEDVSPVKKTKKILLPITGFLTIIGGIFWVWYSLGDVTSGSDIDLQQGIKKSIAVITFNNDTGKKVGDYKCAAISDYVRTQLSQFGKLDVKSRNASLIKNISELEIDYYIEGALSEYGGNRNINVKLVNAKTESILWDEQYLFIDDQIFTYQDTIIKNILDELEIDPIGNDITSSTDIYKNQGNFKLIGKGILNFDKKKYPAAIKAFDSVLESDPENIVALYHKANSFVKLDNFQEAMTIYKNILSQSIDINPIQLSIPIPEKKI